MTTKEIVENYYKAIIAGNYKKALEFKASKATYWICGEGSWAFGGWQDDEGMGKIMKQIGERFPKGIQLKVKAIVADDHNAAVHLENYGIRKDGRIYNNQVIIINTISDGLISEQFEYLDTILANELLCGDMN